MRKSVFIFLALGLGCRLRQRRGREPAYRGASSMHFQATGCPAVEGTWTPARRSSPCRLVRADRAEAGGQASLGQALSDVMAASSASAACRRDVKKLGDGLFAAAPAAAAAHRGRAKAQGGDLCPVLTAMFSDPLARAGLEPGQISTPSTIRT